MSERNSLKVGLLKSVQDDVKSNGHSKFVYYNEENGLCCTVGYLFKHLGLTDEELTMLGGAGIDSLILENLIELKQSNSDFIGDQELLNKVGNLFNSSSLTMKEISYLQDINDDNDDANVIVHAIDNIINDCIPTWYKPVE